MNFQMTVMKKIALAFVGLVLLASSASAQVPSDITDFTSHGIHVILRNSNANEVVGIYLGVEGGLAYGETQNPAVAGLTTGVLTESGSDKYPKEVFRDTLAKLSTSIGGGGSIYSMNFTLRTVVPNLPAAWDIFKDLLTHPHYDMTEFQRQSQLAMNGIKGRTANPEGYTNFVNDSLWFGNSPLNKHSEVSDVKDLTPDKLGDYYHSIMQRSRMTLVIVGKVSRAEVDQMLAGLEEIPEGAFKYPPVDHVTPPSQSSAYLMSRQLPTTYFLARFSAPNIGTKDWWAERVLFQALDKRLFDEVRTKRNLSYAPGSYVTGTRGNMYGMLTLQSVLPDSAAAVVIAEIRKLQTTLLPKQELEDAKQSRITTFFYVMQKNLDQARNLYNNQMESGDWRSLFKITSETPKVTAADVKAVANKYMHHFLFTLLGPDKATATTQPATKSKYLFD
jgi:zinc protease